MYARPGLAKLLRAPWNFELDYDTQPGSVPILFTAPYSTVIPAPGVPDVYTALDIEAAQVAPPPGISPMLAKMMAVPMGSTVMLMYPIVQATPTSHAGNTYAYVWRVIFRMRSVADYQRRKRSRVPWSIPLSRFGTPDTRVGTPPNRPATPLAGPRVVRPCVPESVIYNRNAPTPAEPAPYTGLMVTDSVRIPYSQVMNTYTARYPGAVLDPGNFGGLDYEQGERDPQSLIGIVTAPRNGPAHVARFLKCMGNEMAVECFKVTIDPATGFVTGFGTWQFLLDPATHLPDATAEDYVFSSLLGIGETTAGRTPPIDTGVRVLSGSFAH